MYWIRATLSFLLITIAPALAFANEANNILSKMSETDRNSALAGLIKRSDEPCGRITKSFFQGLDKSGNAFWNVRCSNKKAFVVMIYNDATGSTKILECSVLKAVAGVECFKKF